MEVTWRVDDGYVGNGEHTTTIDDDAIEGLSPEEVTIEIEEWVSEDFASLSFDITHIDGKKV